MQRTILAAAIAAVVLLAVGAPSPVAAADEIATSASSTYTVVPEKGHIKVKVTQKITNRIPSTTDSYDCSYTYVDPYYGPMTIPRTCSSTTRYYVNTTLLWVEAGAKNLKVTSNGGSVKVKKDSKTEYLRSYELTFPRIYNGQTRTITATYTVPGGAPRSGTTDRINGAYLNFWALSQATDSAKVTIKVPKAFELETSGGPVTEKVSGKDRVLSSGSIDDPTSFYVSVTGTNPSGFVEEAITTKDGRTVSILGWPGDDDWMEAVRGEARSAIPALEGLIGQPIPGQGEIVISETADSALGYAYIGTYDPDEQLARVSEDYRQTGTVAHELSHAWFNDGLFDARWLSEGYAGWIENATGTVDTACQVPASYPGTGSPSLPSWKFAGPRATETELSVVGYQYDAACSLVSAAADEIGADDMREVIGVLATAESAYEGVKDRSPGAPAGWREWLDAIDERGMAPGSGDAKAIAALLMKYGIATNAELVPRTTARAALASLRSTTGAWDIPVAVTRPMAHWDFRTAETAIATADETHTLTNQVEALLPSIDADASPIRASYEGAIDAAALTAARDQVAAQVAAAEGVAEAVAAAAAEPGPIEQIGLLGTDVRAVAASAVRAVAAFELAEATTGAQQVYAILDGASTAGMIRVGGVVVGVLIVALLAWVVRRRRRGASIAAIGPVVPPMDEDATAVVELVRPTPQYSDERLSQTPRAR